MTQITTVGQKFPPACTKTLIYIPAIMNQNLTASRNLLQHALKTLTLLPRDHSTQNITVDQMRSSAHEVFVPPPFAQRTQQSKPHLTLDATIQNMTLVGKIYFPNVSPRKQNLTLFPLLP